MKNNKSVIIFGASKAGKKAFNILKQLNQKVAFFVDNDKDKCEKMLYGKYVKEPEVLKSIDLDEYYVVIGSMFVNEIRNQLQSFGLVNKINFSDMYSYIKTIVEESIEYSSNIINKEVNKEELQCINSQNVVMALPFGICLGGVEIFCSTISNALNDKYSNTYLLNLDPKENDDITIIGLNHNQKIINFVVDENNYIESIINGCLKLKEYLPLTIIPNNSEEIFLIANILKRAYPNLVRVISVLHATTEDTYEKNLVYSNIISKFICVSNEISSTFKTLLPERKDDIITKISPILINKDRIEYTKNGQPLKIGFAGRLLKEQKRCDLLIKLISDLENRDITYQLHIAGIGEYYDIISKFVSDEGINDKVFMYGFIPNNKMNEFWSSLDIYINISDYEGTSIAMLEALGNGCVPVVTNVSGVKDFIVDGINGFIVDVQDFTSMGEKIEYLYNHREKLSEFGQKCIKRVKEVCSIDKYIEYLENIL